MFRAKDLTEATRKVEVVNKKIEITDRFEFFKDSQRALFPVNLLGGPYIVLMNGSSVTTLQKSNATHTSLYFSYTHGSSLDVEVVGATVVPELPIQLAQLFLLITLAMAIIVTKKKLIRI